MIPTWILWTILAVPFAASIMVVVGITVHMKHQGYRFWMTKEEWDIEQERYNRDGEHWRSRDE